MAGIGQLVPLLILVAFIAVLGFIGYQLSIWSSELADRGKKKLEKQNMSFTPDGGLRVNVREMSNETYADKTQSLLVNTWNNASFPNYKSRLGWNSTQAKNASSPSKSPRPGVSRESSEQSRAGITGASRSGLKPVEHHRGTSPVPGGWS